MAHVTAPQLQQWLQETKLTIDDVDNELDASTSSIVFARLEAVIDTSTWTDETNTPQLVQTILSMYQASALIRRTYAEVALDQDQRYCDWLERMAESTLTGIIDGTIELDGVSPTAGQPSSWPNALTGSTQQYDAAGNVVGDSMFSEDIKFRMGAKF